MTSDQRAAYIEVVGRKPVLPQKTNVQKEVEGAPKVLHDSNSEIRKEQLESMNNHEANEKHLKEKRGPISPLRQLSNLVEDTFIPPKK
jgi:hypothetical protein